MNQFIIVGEVKKYCAEEDEFHTCVIGSLEDSADLLPVLIHKRITKHLNLNEGAKVAIKGEIKFNAESGVVLLATRVATVEKNIHEEA